MEQDSRNTALQDLNGDGKLDLIVTTFEAYPKMRQTIRFFRNELRVTNQMMAVRLADDKRTGVAGQIVADRTNAFVIVSGESYRTQLRPEFRIGVPAAKGEVIGETNLFQIVRNAK